MQIKIETVTYGAERLGHFEKPTRADASFLKENM